MNEMQYWQRFEASVAADELRPVFTELTALATQRLTFDDFLHGEDERDFDLPRLLHRYHITTQRS